MAAIAWMRGAAGVVLSVVALGAAGCSSGDGSPSEAVSSAAAAVKSAGDAVSSAAAEAQKAAESAAAVAKDRLSEVKDGVDARDQVSLGAPATDANGYTTVPVTVRNTDDGTKSFAVQVEFKDESGNLVDTVVMTVSDVAGKGTAEGTARSTHKLSGKVSAQVGTALRY
uniref:Lipoprotein n=1 Tax=Streptomyces sp. NBC_00049 TaxID=2903617 RepID=A0AAU2JZE1_9ACTN